MVLRDVRGRRVDSGRRRPRRSPSRRPPPIDRDASTRTVSLTFRTMPLRVAVLNPERRDLDDVAADRQELEAVGAVLVGRHGAVEAGVDVAGRDGGAGQRRAARVRDRADDGGGGDLGAGRRRQRDSRIAATRRAAINVFFFITGTPSGWRTVAAICLKARQYTRDTAAVKAGSRPRTGFCREMADAHPRSHAILSGSQTNIGSSAEFVAGRADRARLQRPSAPSCHVGHPGSNA